MHKAFECSPILEWKSLPFQIESFDTWGTSRLPPNPSAVSNIPCSNSNAFAKGCSLCLVFFLWQWHGGTRERAKHPIPALCEDQP
jgi:hypothetical protein